MGLRLGRRGLQDAGAARVSGGWLQHAAAGCPVGAFLRFNSGPAPSSQVICHMHIKKSKWKQKGGLWNTEAAHKMGSGYIPYPSACHRMGDGKHGGKKLKTLRAHRKTKP